MRARRLEKCPDFPWFWTTNLHNVGVLLMGAQQAGVRTNTLRVSRENRILKKADFDLSLLLDPISSPDFTTGDGTRK